MRPQQLAKNLLVYLAFFFTLGEGGAEGFSDHLGLFGEASIGFALFSIVAGATYVFNDYRDLAADRLHPTKRDRPLASGRLARGFALPAAAVLVAGGLAAAFVVDLGFGALLALYLGITAAYNIRLKDEVILDIFAIAAGFVIRTAAGAQIIDAPISPWLYVMTSLGALLIALGKRRGELATLGENGSSHRPALEHYSVGLLDHLLSVVAPATVLAYTLYTFTADNLPDDNSMMLTIPFVLYGVLRYLFLSTPATWEAAPKRSSNFVLWLAASAAVLIVATRAQSLSRSPPPTLGGDDHRKGGSFPEEIIHEGPSRCCSTSSVWLAASAAVTDRRRLARAG